MAVQQGGAIFKMCEKSAINLALVNEKAAIHLRPACANCVAPGGILVNDLIDFATFPL